MKKKILLGISGFFLLVSLVTVVWAEVPVSCDPPAATNCPGGSCSHIDSFGDCCKACCPDGKNPTCDSTGCQCS